MEPGIARWHDAQGSEVWLALEPSRTTVLQGEYVLVERIGEHGREVFRARHVRDRRDAVVRIWRGEDATACDRWLERAQRASRVRHPVLPAIETFGRHGEYAYVVSELAEGERLDHFSDRVGIPPIASVVELFRHICVALNAAHRNGLAHEALHPRNVLVTEQENDPLRRLSARVLDLALPAFVRSFPPRVRDAAFMAPEQLLAAMQPGARALIAADARMNVYSCGCLLHYVCTGGTPILGRTLDELVRAQAAGRLLPASRINPQVPPALDAVILCALSPAPSDRFASMAELALALERVHTGSSASGVRPRVLPPVQNVWSASHARAASFDERPTSEAPRAQLHTPLRPPPPPPPPPPQHKPVQAAGSEDATLPRTAPIGLFSSPPAAPSADEPTQRERALTVVEHGASLRTFERVARSLTPRRRPSRNGTLVIAASVAASVALVWSLSAARRPHADSAARIGATSQVSAVAEPRPMPVPVAVQPAPVAARAVEPTSAAPVVGTSERADPSELQRNLRWRARRPAVHGAEPSAPASEATASESKIDALLEVTERHAATAAPAASSATNTAELDENSEPPQPIAPSDASQRKQPARVAPTVIRVLPSEASAKPPALHAHAESSDVVVHGSLATSVVRRAIDRLSAQYSACYARCAAAAGHDAFGVLEVDAEIDEHGRARDAHASGTKLPGLEPCVAQTSARLAADSPPDTGRVRASWKVTFTP